MSSRRVEKREWKPYCDRVSAQARAKQAELEVVSLDLGDQIEAEWAPFYGIVYDPKSDAFELVLEGIDHLIRHPRELYVDEGPEGLETLEIVDSDDAHQIVKLREPLKLPPPS